MNHRAHRGEQHQDRHLDHHDHGLGAAHELGPQGIDHGQQDDDGDRQRFQQQRRRRGGHEGGGVTAEGRGVEGERDDVAGPHEQVQPAGEHAVAEALHQEMHRAAGGGERGAELGIGIGGQQRHHAADRECQPHGIAGSLRHHAQDGENARAHHAADADRYGGHHPDLAGAAIGSGRDRPGGAHRHGSTRGSISRRG